MSVLSTTGSLMAAGCMVAAGVASAAGSAAPSASPSVVVRYADLDLSTEQGAKVLYLRIVNAAQSLCPTVDRNNLSAMSKHEVCVQAAVRTAVNTVSSPMLAATAAAHSKHV